MTDEALALLRLTLTPGLGPVRIAHAIERFGSATEAARASRSALAELPSVGARTAGRIASGLRASGSLARAEVRRADRLGVRLISQQDASYPPLLRQIVDPPPLLYMRGEADWDGIDQLPVAIVGSRKCTSYGREQAARFASCIVGRGLPIVSGGARGVDTAAHLGALRAQGRTVAVLGCGLAHVYPAENAGLFDDIIDGGGVVFSELPLETPPAAENFPARNRIVSGMSLGVVVIEAGRRSGALITARLAAEDHNREVFVLPGRVDSRASEGSLALLGQGGAHPVTCPEDVLRGLAGVARHHVVGTHDARTRDPRVGEGQSLSAGEAAILEHLDEPTTLDELALAAGLSMGETMAGVTVLEVRRLVRRSGDRVSRR